MLEEKTSAEHTDDAQPQVEVEEQINAWIEGEQRALSGDAPDSRCAAHHRGAIKAYQAVLRLLSDTTTESLAADSQKGESMSNDIPDARIECDKCHVAILVKRKRVGEVSIPPFFIAEHSHSSSFTVSIAETEQKGEKMKHQFKDGMTVGTSNNLPEGYSYCENCGVEETDDNRDEECPMDGEYDE